MRLGPSETRTEPNALASTRPTLSPSSRYTPGGSGSMARPRVSHADICNAGPSPSPITQLDVPCGGTDRKLAPCANQLSCA